MRLGQHFGKRKHVWDYLNSRYAYFSEIDFDLNAKLFLYSFLIQCLFMSPVIYWLFQNYHLTEVIIQQKLNLKENMQFEKKWMIFLMLSMMIAQSTAVVFILKKMVLSFYFPESNPHELHQMQQLPITGEPVDPVTLLGESPDAFADRRRAS